MPSSLKLEAPIISNGMSRDQASEIQKLLADILNNGAIAARVGRNKEVAMEHGKHQRPMKPKDIPHKPKDMPGHKKGKK